MLNAKRQDVLKLDFYIEMLVSLLAIAQEKIHTLKNVSALITEIRE